MTISIFDAIKTRRSVKNFDPDHTLSQEERKQLFNLARLSPTAFNIQHWRFVTIEDKALRQNIREKAWDQPQVTDSSLLIVLCADINAWQKEPKRYWASAPQPAQDFILPAIHTYYDGKPQVQRDEIMRSCGIVAQTIMLAAKGMDLDTCPMDGFDFNAVGQMINLPQDHAIAMMIAVGKKAEEPKPKPDLLDQDLVIIKDKFAA